MIENSASLWMVILWVAWALLLFGGFIFGKPWDDGTRRMQVWTRMASSFALVIAAWSIWAMNRDGAETTQQLTLLIAIGMTCGFIGDLFMARLIIKSEAHIFGGIGAFGLGHIAYIYGLLTYANSSDMVFSGGRWAALIVWWLIGLVGWYIVIYRGAQKSDGGADNSGADDSDSVLPFAALAYALLLATTVGVATGLALSSSAFILTALGAALFLLSDLILAARLFNGLYFRLIDDVVWLTYGPGQMLIVFGMLSVVIMK